MLCPLCEDYDEPRTNVAAHICGRHDADHEAYVGLKDDGTPLSREEHQRRKQEPDPEPEPEPDDRNGDWAALATVLGGLAADEYLDRKGSNSRERM